MGLSSAPPASQVPNAVPRRAAAHGAAPSTTVDRKTVIVATFVMLVFMGSSVAVTRSRGEATRGPAPPDATSPDAAEAASNAPIAAPSGKTAVKTPPSNPATPEVHPSLSLSDAIGRREWHRVVTHDVQLPDYKRILTAHHAACTRAGAVNVSLQPTTAIGFVGPTTVSLPRPGWVRFWLAAKVGDALACRGGDVIEVSAQSDAFLPRVDLPLDLGNGLYEVRFYARRGGEFKVCAEWVISYAAQPPHDMGDRVAVVNDDFYARLPNTRWDRPLVPRTEFKNPDKLPHCSVGRSWANAVCTSLTINIDAKGQQHFDKTITAQRKQHGTRCSHPDAFRSGAWLRMPNKECDGNACVGPLSVLESHGWVWASDWCTVTIYDAAAAWSVVGNRWIAAWGDSTLKQPVANFMEYTLHVPVFPVSMERLETFHPKKHRPNFFSYRQYDVTRWRPSAPNQHDVTLVNDDKAPAVTVTMAWGGCPNPGAPPGCADSGMKNRAYMTMLLEKYAKTGRLPEVVLMNHFVWRPVLYSETEYLKLVREAVEWLHSKIVALIAEHNVPNPRMPLFIWVTPTRGVVGGYRGPACSAEDAAAFTSHLVLLLEAELTARFPFIADAATRLKKPSVLVLSRYDLTYPFHYDDTYCHFGVHYGATRGMCLTGISYKDGYALKNCLRETFPDGMLIQWWLNAIAAVSSAEA